MSEKFPNEFNPEGRKEYEEDLPEWKKEGEMLKAIKIMIVHDLDANEYYPAFIYSADEEAALEAEYNVPDSAQKVEDIIDLEV